MLAVLGAFAVGALCGAVGYAVATGKDDVTLTSLYKYQVGFGGQRGKVNVVYKYPLLGETKCIEDLISDENWEKEKDGWEGDSREHWSDVNEYYCHQHADWGFGKTVGPAYRQGDKKPVKSLCQWHKELCKAAKDATGY